MTSRKSKDESEFFLEQQGAAVLKHGLIRQYLQPFAMKVGSTAPGGRVYYLDTHAGPGAYGSGKPGSPALAAGTAEKIAGFRAKARLKCLYIERDPDLFRRLEETVASVDHEHRCFPGSVEDRIDDVLAEVGDAPLFTFTDPFGLGVPFDLMAHMLLRPSRVEGVTRITPTTELLLNFSLPGIRRNAGKALSESPQQKGREAIGERMDATLGGAWWRDIWQTGHPEREQMIFVEYHRRLREAAGGYNRWIAGQVADRWRGPAVYMLLFLTRSEEGIRTFIEALSHATEDFYKFTHRRGPLPLDYPLETREAQWIATIASNVEQLIVEAGAQGFLIGAKIREVYGDAFGFARRTHLRQALVALHKAGKVAPKPQGNPYELRIASAGG